MHRDIQKVLESDDTLKMWEEIEKQYLDRYYKVEHNPEGVDDFIVCASDAGIVYAHIQAALYFILQKKDYEEAERRLFMLYDSGAELTAGDSRGILSVINELLNQGNDITEGMHKIIYGLKDKGFNIEQNENGFYRLAKRK